MPKFICSECGKTFDPEHESYEYDHLYDHLLRPVCADCERELWESVVEDVFIGECKVCRKEIDIMKEYTEFYDRHQDGYVENIEMDLENYKGYCSECAEDKAHEDVRDLNEDYETYHY